MSRVVVPLWLCAAFTCTAASASSYSIPEHKVGLRLHIAQSGRVDGCSIVAPSDQPESDNAICTAMAERARIRPIGSHQPGEIVTIFRWRGDGARLDRSYQPDDLRLLLFPSDSHNGWLLTADYPDELLGEQAQRIEVRYAVATSGRITDCKAAEGETSAALADWTCKMLQDRRILGHASDDRGMRAFSTYSVFFWTPTATRVCDAEDACARLKSWLPETK